MKKLLLKPLLILSPIVLALIAGEILLRLFFPIEIIPSSSGVRNNPMGWGPDLTEVCDSIPEGVLSSSRQRVLLLGDSILNCWDEKDAAEKVPGVLRQILAQTRIDVLNLSSGGWGTDQEYLVFKKIGKGYRSSLVYLFFTSTNDLWNNLSRTGSSPPRSKPIYSVSPNGELAVIPPEPMVSGSYWPMLLHTQVGARLYAITHRRKTETAQFADASVGAFLKPAPQWVEKGWNLTRELIRSLKKEVESSGGKLVVVYVPVGVNTAETKCPAKACLGYDSSPTTLECDGRTLQFDIYQPYEKLKEITSDLRIPLIDNLDHMGTYKAKHNDIAYDCLHLSPLGSSLLAGRVAEYTNAMIGPVTDPRTASASQ